MVVTTGAIGRAKLQSNHHHQQTNIQFFYRPDAVPVLCLDVGMLRPMDKIINRSCLSVDIAMIFLLFSQIVVAPAVNEVDIRIIN